jgi:hypothetical protein
MKHFSALALILAATTFSVVMGSASWDERFKRDAVDSHAEDMAKMQKLNSDLQMMKKLGSLKTVVKSQRRSDQVDVPFSDPTLLSTTTTVPPPMARMAGEASTTAHVQPSSQSTAAPAQPSSESTVVPAHPATVSSGNASVLSTSGSRDCVHPKDLSCTKEKPYDGQTVSVGAVNK